jgi:hypothetical protein
MNDLASWPRLQPADWASPLPSLMACPWASGFLGGPTRPQSRRSAAVVRQVGERPVDGLDRSDHSFGQVGDDQPDQVRLQVLGVQPSPRSGMVPARGEAGQVDRRGGVRNAASSVPRHRLPSVKKGPGTACWVLGRRPGRRAGTACSSATRLGPRPGPGPRTRSGRCRGHPAGPTPPPGGRSQAGREQAATGDSAGIRLAGAARRDGRVRPCRTARHRLAGWPRGRRCQGVVVGPIIRCCWLDQVLAWIHDARIPGGLEGLRGRIEDGCGVDWRIAGTAWQPVRDDRQARAAGLAFRGRLLLARSSLRACAVRQWRVRWRRRCSAVAPGPARTMVPTASRWAGAGSGGGRSG